MMMVQIMKQHRSIKHFSNCYVSSSIPSCEVFSSNHSIMGVYVEPRAHEIAKLRENVAELEESSESTGRA